MDPVYIEKYQILDILYNDIGEYVIIHNGMVPAIEISLPTSDSFIMHECSEKFGRVYTLSHPELPELKLCINGETGVYNVNKFPTYTDKTIMSTVVKNEDEYILQWIHYYSALGVTHFIIYDNSQNPTLTSNYTASKGHPSKLSSVLKGLDNVLLINWPYQGQMFQPAHENHSVNAFRTSRYIGFLDIDEYVNPQGDAKHLSNILPEKCETGGQLMLCRNFRNPYQLPEHGIEFLKIYTCDPIVYGAGNVNGSKIWVHPPNVRTVLVHDITNGLQPTKLSSEVVYFNHYRFLNKHYRGREMTINIDDSIKRIVSNIFT